MIPCQVLVIAEICIRHAKIFETVQRYKTTLQSSTINTAHHILQLTHKKQNINNIINIILRGCPPNSIIIIIII